MLKRATLILFLCIGIVGMSLSGPTKMQDPDSHCAAMKSNPECRNYGDKKNCDCKRERGEDGKCPQEGTGCENHCCR